LWRLIQKNFYLLLALNREAVRSEACILAVVLVPLLATPLALGEKAPTSFLVYEVISFGGLEDDCLYGCYLFVQVVDGNSSRLSVNVTFAKGDLVRVRDYIFVRPREAASLLLAVDRENWSAYANGVHVGRLPFYGLEPGEPAISLATATGVVTFAAVNATLIAVADRNYVRILVGNLTRDLPTLEYWPGLIDLLNALGVERLELYSAMFDRHVSLLFDLASGILCSMQVRNYSESPVTILKLLGIEGNFVSLQLFKASADRPPVALSKEAPVDPPERTLRITRFVPI